MKTKMNIIYLSFALVAFACFALSPTSLCSNSSRFFVKDRSRQI